MDMDVGLVDRFDDVGDIRLGAEAEVSGCRGAGIAGLEGGRHAEDAAVVELHHDRPDDLWRRLDRAILRLRFDVVFGVGNSVLVGDGEIG